ncbi:hypothetical protein C8J57DRAFT_1180347 [Mycena rebaudengoi]|nr:hypothetical protein C8J57DRAFT_1180347 [Mycena rebaudengoi]
MGFEGIKIKVGHAGAKFGKHLRRAPAVADASCATGNFYTEPAPGSSHDALQPIKVSWKPELNCLPDSPARVDILLTAPGLDQTLMQKWANVPYADGSFTMDVLPRWWGATPSMQLAVQVIPAGSIPAIQAIPAGPFIIATYAEPATGKPAAVDVSLNTDNKTTKVTSPLGAVSQHHLSKGRTAAAVLLPLFFVGLAFLAYMKWSRGRTQKKKAAWSEKLDKRMSTISADWKSITGAGAKEVVRHSIAAKDGSAFAFGAIRPSIDEMTEKEAQPRTSLGSGVGVGVGARRPKVHANGTPDRASRAISFADTAHPRPSVSSTTYSRGSRAFHTASTYADEDWNDAPPVPALPSPSQNGAYGASPTTAISPFNNNTTYTTAPTRVSRSSSYSGNRVSGGVLDNAALITASVGGNGGAWISGTRVEGVDGEEWCFYFYF